MWAILLLTLTIVLLFEYFRRCYTYWRREGIPEEPPTIPFGMLQPMVKKRRSMGLIISDIYKKHNTKFVGVYMMHKPNLLIRDAALALKIMTTDFASFQDRGFFLDENDELATNLFNMRGASWRNMRNKLTPLFSSGKIKAMFSTIDEVGNKLVQHLQTVLEKAPLQEILMKDMMTTYSVDIVGSVFFGLDIDSFTNPENEFRTVINTVFNQKSLIIQIHNFASVMCPIIGILMNRIGLRNSMLDVLRDIVRHTVETRERHNIVRKDFLQLLIRLRNTGKIGDDDDIIWNMETELKAAKSMSIDKIAAHSFLFYIAGAETTAATAGFTLYELAMYPKLLKAAREEVDAVLLKHNLKPNGAFTYEVIQDMKFLESCILETIRKYPGLPFLNRECTQDYPIEGENYTIKKGTPIIIGLFGIHRDGEYFPNPNGYEPHRFDAQAPIYDPTAYMPFGQGPRHCIAARMGKIQSKLAVAKILANFDICEVPRHDIEFKFDQGPFLLPENGLKLRLTKRTFV